MYKKAINDYFNSCQSIEIGINTMWDTSLCKLEIFDSGYINVEYLDLHQISKRFKLTQSQVESFFVIHNYISNHLYGLIGDKPYNSWITETNKITVFFNDGTFKFYGVDLINESMLASAIENGVTWDFVSLLSEQESHQLKL